MSITNIVRLIKKISRYSTLECYGILISRFALEHRYDLDGKSEGPRYSYNDEDDDDDDYESLNRSSFCSRLFGSGGSISRNSGKDKSMLYFGLASNAEQRTTVKLLEKNGCCTLLGPPGTGKSQTIANVICHYLAHGRRVLVTSKGVPATEVLRKKLPAGIRELCVALGGGDSNSYVVFERTCRCMA